MLLLGGDAVDCPDFQPLPNIVPQNAPRQLEAATLDTQPPVFVLDTVAVRLQCNDSLSLTFVYTSFCKVDLLVVSLCGKIVHFQ